MTEHENVNAAVQQLDHAIHQLTGTRTEWVNGKLTTRPSRYDEIIAIRNGETGTGEGGNQRSRSPIWVEAWAWLEDAARTFANIPNAWGDITRHPWRPQDLNRIHNHTTDIRELTARADQLLDEQPHNFELTAPCPACGERTVYRQDAGETVRRAALTIGAHGCECLNCRQKWSPEYFVHLSRVLGCELPKGVLE